MSDLVKYSGDRKKANLWGECLRKTAIAILIYSIVHLMCGILLWRVDFYEIKRNTVFRYLYALLVAIAFVLIGRIPLGILHYLGGDRIADGVIGLFSITYFVSSIYLVRFVIRKMDKSDTILEFGDSCGSSKENGFRYLLLVLFPIMALLVLLLIFSDHFAMPRIAAVLEGVVLAPFYEEIGFRVVLPRIVDRNGNITKLNAIIYSTMFTLLHIGGNNGLSFYLTIFASSLYCYFLVSITKKVKYSILYHALGNLSRLFFSV